MDIQRIKKINPTLNLTPLIDMVFLLVIFFMLTSHFISQTGIEITLPTSSNQELFEDQDITIYITKDNKLILNGNKVLLAELEAMLKGLLKDSPDKPVIMKADEKISLKFAVEVMDAAKRAEATNLVISTELEKDGGR